MTDSTPTTAAHKPLDYDEEQGALVCQMHGVEDCCQNAECHDARNFREALLVPWGVVGRSASARTAGDSTCRISAMTGSTFAALATTRSAAVRSPSHDRFDPRNRLVSRETVTVPLDRHTR